MVDHVCNDTKKGAAMLLNSKSEEIWIEGSSVLNDLQVQTLIEIFSVCPRPSMTVINLISAEMNLSKDCVMDFLAQRKQRIHLKQQQQLEKKCNNS